MGWEGGQIKARCNQISADWGPSLGVRPSRPAVRPQLFYFGSLVRC